MKPSARRGLWLMGAGSVLALAMVTAIAARATAPAEAAAARQADVSGVTTLTQAEAVASDWDAEKPSVTGWVPVKLMDYWNQRWPRHDGVVWYRLHWNQAGDDAPIGLVLDYVCMADAVWVNGSLVQRDPSLVEPLSRSWTAPQYFLLDRPLLRAGENTLLIRVSGLAAYQPGFGVVRVGTPAAVYRLYRQGMFWRYNIHLFNFAVSAVLGVLFLMFWLLRRRDSVFGWYALATLLGAGYAWNYVAGSTWPFASTDAWQAVNAALFVATAAAFCVFLLRFCGRRRPWLESALLLAAACSVAMALGLPHVMGPLRNLWMLPAVAVYYLAILIFLWHAVRVPRADIRALALCLLVPVAVSVQQLLVFLQVLHSSNYDLLALTSPVSLIGMSFAVAWRFAAAMRRVEGFNVELRHEVETATARLTATLGHAHTLALANAHANERLNLVRDLHDGFGGSLVGAIARLEHQASPEAAGTVATLKELRDDLRLVIDTTTHDQDMDLVGLLAPLRHRWNQRLELAGIDARWHLDGLDGCRLGTVRSLDLLRFLQECLTNVLKHSGAAHAVVAIARTGVGLDVAVRDDGRGFDPAADTRGAGLASLAQRCRRLDGQMRVIARVGNGTNIELAVPIDASAASASQPD